ncbi:hypothetical protein D3C86_1943750 [compost metagenome]
MVSPPQKCLNMVALMIPLIGNPMFRKKLVTGGPTFVKKLLLMILKSQYAAFNSPFDLLRKAISVSSKFNDLLGGVSIYECQLVILHAKV